jgi:hypothetical protein
LPTPIVVSTVPTVGATDVPVADAIQFTFNTPLLSSSVTQATFVLYNDDSGELIIGQITLSADGKTITLIPNRTLLENVPYLVAAIGASDNAAGGNIKASDGTDLPDTYQVSFRTRVERYVPLSEVADRDDLIDVGPIREDDPAASVDRYLEVDSASPPGFATDQDRTLSEIIVCFGEDVIPTGSADALELIINNVLGIDEYYGEGDPRPPDPSGRFLQDCLATGDPRQALFTGQVFGNVSFSGECVRWDKAPGSQDFHYNSEIVVRVRKDSITNPSGDMLEEDVYFTFTSEYWPLYTGVQYIRLKLGRAISSLFDDTINRHIHAASIDAVQQAGCCFDTEHPYAAVRRYVQACTILSILDEIGLLPALQAGRKKLGDLDIQYNPQDMAKIVAAYRRAEEEKKKALFELRYYRRQSRPMVVVKGQNYAGERRDFRMRTWQGLRARPQPSANTAELRRYKSRLAFDHPTEMLNYIGWDEDGERITGTSVQWWT